MNTEKACRVCLSECEELTPLCAQLPGENKTLEEAINFVANIDIKLENGLPDKICKTCESVLDLADSFKQRCLESESILEQKAREKPSDVFDQKEKYQQNSEIYSEGTSCLPTSISHTLPTNTLRVKNEKAENICDFPEPKIKIEIQDLPVDDGMTIGEQGYLDTAEYEVPIENCCIKQEFSAETMKCFDNTETFCCPHCSLTFKTKFLYKVHIFSTHSTFGHMKDAPSLKGPTALLENMHPTIAKFWSATKDPAAADTSTALIISSDIEKVEKSHIIQKIGEDIVKKDTATIKQSVTKTDDKITFATENQSECSSNTVIGFTGDIPTCDICGYTTARLKSLRSHLKKHTATKQYSCDLCLYLTDQLNHYNAHLMTHTNDKLYSCDVCGKKFSQNRYLITHYSTHSIEKPYSCDLCEKSFTRKSYLTNHMRTHTGEKPYPCDVCGKNFNQSWNLIRHLATHSGEKPYPCDVCGKSFACKSNLVYHMRTHTGEKPYPCDVCGKNFNRSRNLIRHLGTHRGEKPYPCDVCGKSFACKSNVVHHMRIHTGEKPYSCDVCEKRFIQKSTLVAHVTTHTSDKPYSCDVCEKKFRQKRHLMRHLKTHSGE